MNKINGFYIIVLDQGFVYAGECYFTAKWLTIIDAKNIRRWGTKNGLGELRNGPTADTLLDDSGTVLVPISRIVHLLRAKWK